jgi:hypothetical protein
MSLGNQYDEVSEKTVKTTAFSKVQLSESLRYKDRKDVVNILLKDDVTYSFDEVDCLINEFMRGKVK